MISHRLQMKSQAERLAHMNAKAMHIRLVTRNEDYSDIEAPEGVVTLLINGIKELEAKLRTKRAIVEEIRHHVGPSPPGLQESMTASMYRVLNAVSPYAVKNLFPYLFKLIENSIIFCYNVAID